MEKGIVSTSSDTGILHHQYQNNPLYWWYTDDIGLRLIVAVQPINWYFLSGDLFAMVKTWHFQRWMVTDPTTIGDKNGHGLNHHLVDQTLAKIHLVDVENPINKWDIRYRSLNWCWKDILQNPWPPPSDTARWWACWRDEGPNLRIRWSGLVRVYPYYKPSLRFRISKAWDSLGFWWKNCLPNPCWISVVNLISWMNLGVLNRWEDFLRRFNTNTSHKKNGSMDAAWPAKGQKDTYLEEVILNC